jgi:phage baseplate assembly protein W
MDPQFGVGARRFLFENASTNVFESFKSKLLQQVQRYMPYLQIRNVKFVSSLDNSNVDENFLGIKISYFNTATGQMGTMRVAQVV